MSLRTHAYTDVGSKATQEAKAECGNLVGSIIALRDCRALLAMTPRFTRNDAALRSQ